MLRKMLHRESGSKAAHGQGLAKWRPLFLSHSKVHDFSLSRSASPTSTPSTLLRTRHPHDQGPVNTPSLWLQPTLLTAEGSSPQRLDSTLRPELSIFHIFLFSSLAPFPPTSLLPRRCSSLSFSHHELFFLHRVNTGNAFEYQQ